MGTVSALKKQAKQQDQIREIFGGKAISGLSSAELANAIPQIEALVAGAKGELQKVESQVKGKAAEMLGTEGGLENLRNLSEKLIPLRTEYDALQMALDGANSAFQAALAREKQAAVDTARAALEEILGKRFESAARIEGLMLQFAEEFACMQALGRQVVAVADDKLRTVFNHGFKMQGNTGAGLRPQTLQHEIEIFLAQHVPGWEKEALPFGVRKFTQMTNAWHTQILSDFDSRFDDLQSGKIG